MSIYALVWFVAHGELERLVVREVAQLAMYTCTQGRVRAVEGHKIVTRLPRDERKFEI